jgi:hypothetical protein
MALTRSDNRSRRPAKRYRDLLPHEQEQIVVHRHGAILISPAVAVLFGLALAGLASSLPVLDGYPLLAIWLAWTLLLLRLFRRVIKWLPDHFVVTSERIMVVSGILARDVAMIPFSQLLNVSYRAQFGFGTLTLAVDDELEPFWEIDFLPYPEQLCLEILELAADYLPNDLDSL